MQRITSAEFVVGAAWQKQFPNTAFPEVAFAGRSNVGKSSLLNALLGRKSLARISNTPGRTQQINFFRVNERYHFVDLPGYGYAKASKTDRQEWASLIESYLQDRRQLRLLVALVDIRHDPSPLDLSMFEWLESVQRRFVIVLTKHDKVSAAQAAERIVQLEALTSHYSCCLKVTAVSSQTRQGCEHLLKLIGSYLDVHIPKF